jgi:hypothetical protein
LTDRRRVALAGAPVAAALALLLLTSPVARAAPLPESGSSAAAPAAALGTLPVALDREFLPELALPSVTPGGTTSLTFTVADPAAFVYGLASVVATFQLYAFNGYPGNGSAQLPVADAPLLENATASAPEVNVSVGSLTAGGPAFAGSLGVVTSGDTPAGTYAVRTALSFVANATAYLLESRGWFSASVWAAATILPNGTPTLNLSRLNVSGVIPETALLVSPSDWPWALGAILGASFVLMGAGTWVYYRRRSSSRSGTG